MLRLRQDRILFPEGKKKAFTMSYDDGVTQDGRLTEMMRKYHLKGTFNLNSGLMGDQDWLTQPGIDVSHYKYKKEEIQEIYEGFEIAVHSQTHPNLANVPEGMIAYEVASDKKNLEEIRKCPIRGMAYPFGTYNETVKQVLAQCGIVYSRTVKSTGGFEIPEDFLEWHPTCHHTQENMEVLGESFLKPIEDEKYRTPQLFYLWGHSYEFDAHKEWERIENFLQKMANQVDIWYAANIEIYDYIQAVKSLIYSASGDYIMNPTCIDVWMQIDGIAYKIESGKTVEIRR